jgi:hypothetical protein
VFAGLRLPSGKTTVMHLVAREHLPEPNSQSKTLELLTSYNEVFDYA